MLLSWETWEGKKTSKTYMKYGDDKCIVLNTDVGGEAPRWALDFSKNLVFFAGLSRPNSAKPLNPYLSSVQLLEYLTVPHPVHPICLRLDWDAM